jgi:superfamily II RNA helicase
MTERSLLKHQLDLVAKGEDLLTAFLSWVESRNLQLYPAQEEAIIELFSGKNVFLNTPTGSGKSLVALALHFESLASNRRSVYTCPIKALVNEKWMALCQEFGPENVGLSTGDATVNRDAPILCCTAEILSNMALSEGSALNISDIVMDEFHYYSDKERGVAWQIPLLTLPQSRFLLMSATVGNTEFFEKEMTRVSGRESITIRSLNRPVPLEFSYSEEDLQNQVQRLLQEGKAPIYVVHFSQREAAQNAQNLSCLEICNKEERSLIAKEIENFRFSSPYGPDVKRWLRLGIGVHHAGLLPKYRILVEKLAQKGLLKIICGTDTLGVGVNVPIRTVLFTKLCKYSGDKTAILSVRDFHQIAGRAGRKGFDNVGYVVAQAPEHVIENKKLAAKSQKTGKKFAKKQPPEKGFVPWDKGTFERLIQSNPEPLKSSFQVSHGMLLNILSRPDDGCFAIKQLLRDCHEEKKSKRMLRARAMQLFRSLVEKNIVEFCEPKSPGMAKVQVNLDLQDDFSMNQPLSLYLIDTLPKLDKESPDYALNVLSLVESIVENPDLILKKQLDKLKTEVLNELKAEGVEYEKRMAILENLEYPKPLREFIYNTYNEFAEIHPWVDSNVYPKSVVREMFENFSTFSSYVKQYSLERSEAILLRHINATYKVLSQTVPDSYKNESLIEMEDYLGEMIHRIDSSLWEEWERLKNPDFQAQTEEEKAFSGSMPVDITADRKRFLSLCRMRIFEWMTLILQKRYSDALDFLADDLAEGELLSDNEGVPWTEKRLEQIFAAYEHEHGKFRMDAEGRSIANTISYEDEKFLYIEQMLQDFEEINNWSICFKVPLLESKNAAAALFYLEKIGES